MQEVTATVGEPSPVPPIPPRPTMLAVVWYDHDTGWLLMAQYSRTSAEEFLRDNPGSVLVTVPGEE